jgi:hypothetical protein
MVVSTMARPIVTATGATIGDLENLLLRQAGAPAHLGVALRIIDNLASSTLPVPVPSGIASSSTTVHGSPAVVLSDQGKTIAAVVWENAQNRVNLVAGLLDEQDVVNVANQIG